MAALIKALLQPVAIVWLGLLALCVWQIYKRHYRWAAMPGALFLLVRGCDSFGRGYQNIAQSASIFIVFYAKT